jgi:hypothetical protein
MKTLNPSIQLVVRSLFPVALLAMCLSPCLVRGQSPAPQATPPPPAQPRPVSLPKPVEKTLPNGLRVIVY